MQGQDTNTSDKTMAAQFVFKPNFLQSIFILIGFLAVFADAAYWGGYIWKSNPEKPVVAKIEKFWTENHPDSDQEFWIQADYVDDKGQHQKANLKESFSIWQIQMPQEEIKLHLGEKITVEDETSSRIIIAVKAALITIFMAFICEEVIGGKRRRKIFKQIADCRGFAKYSRYGGLTRVFLFYWWLLTLVAVFIFSSSVMGTGCFKESTGKVEKLWRDLEQTRVTYSYKDDSGLLQFASHDMRPGESKNLKIGDKISLEGVPIANSGMICRYLTYTESVKPKLNVDSSSESFGSSDEILAIAFLHYILLSGVILYLLEKGAKVRRLKQELMSGAEAIGTIGRVCRVGYDGCSMLYEFEDSSGVKHTGETMVMPFFLASKLAVNAITKVWYDPQNPERNISEIG